MNRDAQQCDRLFSKAEIEQSITDRFGKQVQKHGKRLAIGTPSDSLTYIELDIFSNRIANAILKSNTLPSEPVAMLFEQGSSLIAAILGVLKTGKIYVPLDSKNSLTQIEYVLADSRASLILTDVKNYPQAVSLAKGQLRVVEVENDLHSISGENPSIQIAPDTFAYIYYTSGSTGQPKGVVDDHRNVLHNVMRYTNSLKITHHDRLTLLQSSGFSGAVSNIFCSLLNGASLFPIDLHRAGINGLASCISSNGITIYHSVPTIFQKLSKLGQNFNSLRIIRLEGDRATLKDLFLFKKHFNHECLLVNGLGATETGITRQYFANTQSMPSSNYLPIGLATEDMETVLLDENGNEVAPGEVGEIAIRSRYLACGYWQQAGLTRARFIPNPDDPDERTYLSGDLGCLNSNDELIYLGRKDLRHKFRGEWLDTETIELELSSDDKIEQSLVDVRVDNRGIVRIVAYVVASKGAVISVSELRKKLVRAGIRESIIPSAFVQLDALPLDANGKVSRRKLPEPHQAIRSSYAPVKTETERRVADAFALVLGYSQVGRNDDFYALGGDSLDVVSVCHELEKNLSSTLPLALFSHATTVEKLASAIDQNKAAGCLVKLQPNGSLKPFFCVHAHMGHVIRLSSLSIHLGTERPFYALQLQGLDLQSHPPTSMTEMAQQYLTEIRTIQEKGPYLIGGYCYGGIVAIEMARLLQQVGESVSLLALIDTDYPFGLGKSSMALKIGKLWRRVVSGKKFHWHNILRYYGSQISKRTKTAALRIIWRYCLRRAQPIPGFLRRPRRLLKMIEQDYVPQQIHCRAAVFIASEDQEVLPIDELWQNLIKGEVTIHRFPVTDEELLREPHVRLLANSLARFLDE